MFPKRLTHGFGQKMAIFPSFFLGNIGQENVFYDILEQKKRLNEILERKNTCLGYNNKKLKKSEVWHFF